jgi:Periplasmic binding protein
MRLQTNSGRTDVHGRTATLALVAGLALAACSSDGETSESATSDTPGTASASAGTEPVGTQPPGGIVDSEVPGTTEAIELTDSFQGVTAESIDIGVAYIDFERMNEEFGFDLAAAPIDDAYAAWAAALNEAGGINGRTLEVTTKGFLPVGETESTEVCTELLEDEQVFAVIGQFLLDNALCVTETYGHPYVGLTGETAARQESSQGRLFAVDMALDDQRVESTEVMLADGAFDGKKVGVVWTNPPEQQAADAVVALLEESGVEVTSAIEVGTMGTDAVANDAAWAATIERLESEGTDIMLSLGDLGVLNAIGTNSSEMTVGLSDALLTEGARFMPQVSAGDEVRSNTVAVAISRPTLDELLADPEVQRCLDEYAAAFPDAPIDTTSVDIVNSFVAQCRAFRMTVEILTAAGGDITPDTFVAAGESIGDITLPGVADGFLGPDKHSAGSELQHYVYDPDSAQFVGSGEPISIL